jgi:antitoxin component of MazEF toxin-antitoxin module
MTINLPDEVVTALQSQAKAQGISLQSWFERLAVQLPAKPHYTLDELLKLCDANLPLTEEDRIWLDDHSTGREAL